jgi:ABC-type uncharacterized transport system ATPase subunit
MSLIEVAGLRRTFTARRRVEGERRKQRREVEAVRDLNFAIDAGEMVGYIGPNGAGKSTTVKMLTGILVPTSGRISVAGVDPSRHRTALARRIGVVFGQRTSLWWDLPLHDFFELLQKIYRTDSARHRANLAEFVELLDLGDLQDIEALCDRVIVIDHGTQVYDGTLPGLHEQGGSRRTVVVDLVDEAPPIEVAGAVTRRVEGPRQWLSFPADANAAPIVAALASSYDVADLSIQEPDIEEVIRELYSRPPTDPSGRRSG